MLNEPYLLIVDDDVALLQALPQALYLRIDGMKVDTTDSAQEALGLIQEHDYDAIVSDIKMPGMDGLVLLAKIKELRPDTPTLLITGHGEENLAIQALRGGAYDFIQKPIERDYFVAALQRAIQTHQLRRQVIEQQLELGRYAQSLEQTVQERTRELVEANTAKDEFLSIASHELKTPLASLKGMAQLLRRRLERNASIEVVNLLNIERSIRRLELLVSDLLNTSLIETGTFVLKRQCCDLIALCRDVIEEYKMGAGPAVPLTFETPNEPIEVEVDIDRISQVILNLLSNARKYSSAESPITITLQRAGESGILSVRDGGVGIPAEMIPHIFERFYRVPGVEVQTGSGIGLGLGLYISRKIVERHGGHIEVQSIPGNGSTFSIMLPLYIDPTADDVDANKLAPHTQAVWTIAH
jgi:two-component system, sensor histidine kinase and response regulator